MEGTVSETLQVSIPQPFLVSEVLVSMEVSSLYFGVKTSRVRFQGSEVLVSMEAAEPA